MRKIKKLIKNRIFIFTVAALLFGTIGVSAATYFPSVDVTYDNKESGLVSTDVQGAIDELYVKAQQVSSGSDDRVEDMGGTVSSGDGLYADSYEEGRYFYKGANPNNYITFNGETAGWRIISLEPDGTIKIMKIASIGDMAWDSSSSNNWVTSSLNNYLNNDYYNSLNSAAQSQIVSHIWKVGLVLDNNDCLTDNVNSEGDIRWTGKVGLATSSEYLRSNSNMGSCRSMSLLIDDNYNTCKSTTWMFNDANWWTMSPWAGSKDGGFYVDPKGTFNYGVYAYVNNSHGVRPVVYLSSSVKLSGSGTSSNPYTISS